MLTGDAPFARDSPLQTLYAHCKEPVPDPRDRFADLPQSSTEIVSKAMAKKPGDRCQSADLMLAQLEACVKASIIDPVNEEDPSSNEVTEAGAVDSAVEDTTSVRRVRTAARRHVTVVQCSCNVYESTEILESLDFDEQNELLENFKNLCAEVVKEYEGVVVQPTDQGLLVCFGYPMALEDATPRAISAGLEICKRIKPFNEQLNHKAGVRLGARFAIHSDTAIVEDTGEGDTLSLVGPVRNVVSQLVNLNRLITLSVVCFTTASGDCAAACAIPVIKQHIKNSELKILLFIN